MAAVPTLAPPAVIVTEMLETILYASIGGIGIAVVFSIAIYGGVKSVDLARADRQAASILAGMLAVVALTVCLAAAAAGVFAMASS